MNRWPLAFVTASVGLLLVVVLLGASPLLAEGTAKDELLEKYERATALVEELHVYQQDIYKVVPRLRLASQALLRDDLVQADRLLDEILHDLELLETKRPIRFSHEFRLEWLEIYKEVFQKYAVLALLAYLFLKWPLFHRILRTDRMTVGGRLTVTFLVSLSAILFSVFDLSRYGESSWAFFDIQVVILTIGGLLGGISTGLFSGIAVAFFRWTITPTLVTYPIIALGAALLSGYLSRFMRSYRQNAKTGFLAGLLIGGLHGSAMYLPAAEWISWYYLLGAIGFLALLEGIAVFIFFGVLSGLLREESRREMERELLQTKFRFLQAQVNPHFLFNALNAISAICRRERADQAQNLVLKLAHLLKRGLKGGEEMVSLKEEMSYVDSYIEIEKARFQDRLKIVRQFEMPEPFWQTKVPVLTLQPLVENAIKHGISKKETGGTVTIKIAQQNGHLEFAIEDDGVGMNPALLGNLLEERASSNGAGLGIRNTHQRLNHLYGSPHGLLLQSEPGKGTKVRFKIPIALGNGTQGVAVDEEVPSS